MNISLVSDDNEFAQKLKEKLIFLRKNDALAVVGLDGDFSEADVVLVHNDVNLVKCLRKNENLCIVFVANSYDSKLILDAIDAGADDFILADAKDFEFVFRITNTMKYASLKLSATRNAKLLSDEFSGMYRFDYCKSIIDNFKTGTFIALTPCDKVSFSIVRFSSVVKSALRVEDITFSGNGAVVYVFLPKTDFNGAVSVFNKINSVIEISAGMSDISDADYEKKALNALAEAKNGEYVLAEIKESTLDEWLLGAEEKNYKFFRQIFNKKLEKVIAPVFYRLQKSYEEKLFETDIEQFTNEEECVFKLKNATSESVLKIVYPGFAKILIQIINAGLDSPENREIQIPLSKITQKELIAIVEDFIKEFKKNVKCK